MKLIITSSYGSLSRGRHSARKGKGSSVEWADKDVKGRLVITEPGLWSLHCSDGFKREARATLEVFEDGTWDMEGETRRFDVIEPEATKVEAVKPVEVLEFVDQ